MINCTRTGVAKVSDCNFGVKMIIGVQVSGARNHES